MHDFIVLTLIFLFWLLGNFRIWAAAKAQDAVMDAIHHHCMVCVQEGHVPPVWMFDAMEPLWKTVLRFWDWGYDRIVPQVVMDRIRPYIREGI